MTIEQTKNMLKFLEDNNIKDIDNKIYVGITDDCEDGVSAKIYNIIEHGICLLSKTVKETKDGFVILDTPEKLNFLLNTHEEVEEMKNEFPNMKFKTEFNKIYNCYEIEEI